MGTMDGIIDPLLPLIGLLKSHGKLILVGAPEKPLEFPVFPLLMETSEENEDGTLALVKATKKALQVSNKDPKSIIKGTANFGAEYLASRSYHGLDIQSNSSLMLHSFISILSRSYLYWFGFHSLIVLNA
ncbi:putative mannitol dehydrogenase [Camellia lanceoleosa]|uniref:Mannitol dehydrogenase n=1 Tax=Camellia lanceoleosa TaxID=1840588 RepID=A0ACC0HYL8_9ERIC|nr:putative mannitol dehydrogenase [Camellia lanceoleosa]